MNISPRPIMRASKISSSSLKTFVTTMKDVCSGCESDEREGGYDVGCGNWNRLRTRAREAR